MHPEHVYWGHLISWCTDGRDSVVIDFFKLVLTVRYNGDVMFQ